MSKLDAPDAKAVLAVNAAHVGGGVSSCKTCDRFHVGRNKNVLGRAGTVSEGSQSQTCGAGRPRLHGVFRLTCVVVKEADVAIFLSCDADGQGGMTQHFVDLRGGFCRKMMMSPLWS